MYILQKSRDTPIHKFKAMHLHVHNYFKEIYLQSADRALTNHSN